MGDVILYFAEIKEPDMFSTIAYKVNGSYEVVLNWTRVDGAVGYTASKCKGSYTECKVSGVNG